MIFSWLLETDMQMRPHSGLGYAIILYIILDARCMNSCKAGVLPARPNGGRSGQDGSGGGFGGGGAGS